MNSHRRLRRVLRFCLFGLPVVLLLVGGGIWWAHRHLTTLTVEAVNRTFPDLQLAAKTVAFSSTGVLDLKSIQLRVRDNGSTAVAIPSAQVRFSWRELRQRYIREVVIDQPSVRVSDALLKAVLPDVGAAEAEEAAAPWRVGKLTVKGGTARVELAGFPAMRCAFAVQFTEGADAGNHFEITSLRVHDGAEILSLPAMKVRASLADLQSAKLREVIVEAPHFTIDDRVLALLPKSSGGSGASPAWSCDLLSVRSGRLKVDLANWPRAELDFAVHAEHLAAEGGGAFALSLERIAARVSDEQADTLSIASARLTGTLSGLMRGAIQEIAIDDPHIRVTDHALIWRPPGEAGATNQTSVPTPWKAERVTIKRGRVVVDLAGAPLTDFAFAVGLQNAALADTKADDLQSVEVLDLAVRTRTPGVEPILRVPAIRAEFRIPELVQLRRLARLRVEHLDFRYNNAFREMIASGGRPESQAPAPAADEKAPPLTVGELRLTDGHLHLDDLGLGIPAIECRLETAFRELALEPGGGQGGRELQTIELSQIALRSPLDPFVPVLDLDTVFVRFTLAGIWRREIEEIAIVRPTLAIGPDLFWYIDRVQQNQGADREVAPAPVDDGPPWSIRQFSAKSGQLVLALEGQAKLALPMPFESRAENLNFRQLSDLRLKLNIDMPEQDYDYPGYELALRGLSGRIEFSLPPAKRSNNVVNTLRLRGVQWKNFRGRDLYLDVTYDELGIYGKLSGKSYGGHINGQFNCLLTPESDWNAWVSGERIDLRPITSALAPEKFSLTGPADFRVTVSARAREILKLDGDFRARARGDMRIGKIDDFIRELPGDWTGVKRGLSRISLETLRDFAYDTAHGDFHFTGLFGAVHLDLQGPSGARKIEMNFREAPAARSVAPRRVATNRP